MEQRRTVRRNLSLVYVFFYLGYMAFFPFQTVYLTSVGYDKTAVALLTTCTALGNFLIQFPLGRLSGTACAVRRIILLLLAMAVPLGFGLSRFHGTLLAVILAVLPVTLVDFSLIGQLDSYTLSRPEARYSTMRTLGSLTGAAATMLLGGFYTRWGIQKMFWLHGLFLSACLFCVLFLPDGTAQAEPRRNVGGSVKPFLPLFLGGGLLFLPWRMILVYLPVLLLEQGGNASHQGAAMSVMSFCIMPVLMLYPHLRKRCGCRCLLLFGGLAMVLRLGIMAVSSNIRVLILAQLLEALSYGLTQPAIMELLGRAGPTLRPRVVSIWTGIQMALCTVAANGLVTLLSRRFTLNEIFAWMIPPVILGILILLNTPCTKEVRFDAG